MGTESNESCRIVAIDLDRTTAADLRRALHGFPTRFTATAEVIERPDEFGAVDNVDAWKARTRQSEPPGPVTLWLVQLPDVDAALDGPVGPVGALIEAAIRADLVRLLVLARPQQVQVASDCLLAGADDVLSLPLDVTGLAMRMQLHGNAALRKRRREERALRVLLELTQTLASTLDFKDILFTLVRRVAEVAQVDRASLVVAPSQDAGVVLASSDDADVTDLRIDLQRYPEIQHVLSTRKTLIIDDIGTHPMLRAVRESVPPGAPCRLCLLPLAFEDRALGVLLLRTTGQAPRLRPRELGYLEVLANTTAIALRNARVLRALREETARDQDARRVAEERVRALHGYVDLFVSAVDGAIAFDAEGRLLFANPAAYEILGYREATIPAGSPVMDLVVRDERRRMALLSGGFAGGVYPHDIDVRARHRSGREVILNGSFSALRGTAGAALFSFRDCTAARRAEGELRKTQRFLQSLIDASVDAIVASDMRGKIVLFNNGAQRLYGHDPQTAVAEMYVHALYPGDGAREVGRMLRSEQYGGVGRLEPVRTEAIDAAGNLVPISLTAATIYEDGRPTANFGIFCDLREQARMEAALAQAQQTLALTQKQAVVAELAGATAHELNQPLTSIMGCTELVQRRLPVDSPHHGLLSTVVEQVQRMAEIVRKIGDLTRYETKNYVGAQRILDLDSGSDAGAASKTDTRDNPDES